MLLNLSIRNIALIESLSIDFANGLGVLTGETGAGKSLLLDSLMFLTGNKVDARMIKHDANQASIVAEFEIINYPDLEHKLTEYGLEPSNQLLIKRTLAKDGKSKAFINDQPVTLSVLKEITTYLVEINGQNNQRTLLDSSYHLYLVDSFGELGSVTGRVSDAYLQVQQKQDEFILAKQELTNIEKEKDYLAHIAKELEALDLQPDEEELLTTKRVALVNQEKLINLLKSVLTELQGKDPVSSAISSAQRILMRSTSQPPFLDLNLHNAIEGLERANSEIDEVIAALEEKMQAIITSEESLENIEERLFLLRAAARKFQCNIAVLPECLTTTYQKLQLLENMENSVHILEQELAEALNHYLVLAKELSKKRAETALKLEQQVSLELMPLKLDKTIFKIELEPLAEGAISKNGLEKICFLASTNPGMPLNPLAKIASGGELSRFMLVCKLVLSKVKTIPTIIFDEIDTGIGGAVASALGKRLALLAENMQVITITHQPQVAACGDYHLKVSKSYLGNQTSISVNILSPAEREEELARMLSGDAITQQAREAAKSLLYKT